MGAIGRNVAEFSGIKFIGLIFLVFASLPNFCVPFQVTVLDTTNTESLDWVTYFKGESDGRRGWREASYTNEQGDVVRVYTVCNVATTTVDSWLRTPFIATGDANRLYIDMRFGMRKCTKYPHPGRLQQCKESFKLLYYESDTDSADADHPTWDESIYRHVDVIAADKVFTELNRANVNSETRSVPVSRRGVYFAFFDQGACISLLSIRVYYIVCPSVTLNFAIFANTTTGPHLTSIVQREGNCVDHAVVDQLPSYLCKGDGNWYFLTGGCKCMPGYEPTKKPDATLCEACPLQTFKWQTGNDVCNPCPSHSAASDVGQRECRCDDGYYRSIQDDRSLACTRPPSAVQNLTLVYRDQTSVVVSWERPRDFGGRRDVQFRVECIGCTEKTIYEPRQAVFNTTRVTLTGLTPDTSYRIIVHSENGVSRLSGVRQTAEVFANTEAAVPSKITNLRITSVGTDFVSLAWSCPQSHISIDIYEVKYWKDDNADDNVSNFTAWQNITLYNMMQRTRYSFQVRGKTNKGWGEYSDVIYGTTGHISHFPAENPIGIVVGFAISIVICMLIVIIFIAIFVRRNSRIDRKKSAGDCDMLNSSGPCSLGLDGTLILDGGLTMPLFAPPGTLQAYVDPHTYEDPSQAVREFTKEIDAACVTIEAVIGGGEFGDVCKGRMRLPGNGDLIVAIKTLKSGTSDKNRLDFLTEASIMGQFDHPNVIYLEGVVTRSNPIMIVTEYMENGSLDAFLRNNDGRFTVVQLIGMTRGIASGMSYLSEMGYIHRNHNYSIKSCYDISNQTEQSCWKRIIETLQDLAARNILVNENLICKVSDFGLSRELESDASDGVYTTKGGKIPVRWTAPEAIVYRKFTSASDVWSFGVVTWEVMSYGERPYWTWSNQDVIRAVDNGYRLTPPMDCPEAAYELMLDCWQQERSHRPKFTTIVNTIDKLIRAPELLRKIATPRPNDNLWLSRVEDSCSYESVEEWLKDIKMLRYADNFQKCGFTSMDQVTQITHKDLVRLDISLIGHQKKILNSVQALRANVNNAQAGDALLL